MKIGLISDTHLSQWTTRDLPRQVFQLFESCDLILHAGDITSRRVLTRLESLATVIAVAGNNDPDDLIDELGTIRSVKAGYCDIMLLHGHQGRKNALANAGKIADGRSEQVVVFGHSHQPVIAELNGKLFINPGSPTQKRLAPFYSAAILTIGESSRSPMLHTW